MVQLPLAVQLKDEVSKVCAQLSTFANEKKVQELKGKLQYMRRNHLSPRIYVHGIKYKNREQDKEVV